MSPTECRGEHFDSEKNEYMDIIGQMDFVAPTDALDRVNLTSIETAARIYDALVSTDARNTLARRINETETFKVQVETDLLNPDGQSFSDLNQFLGQISGHVNPGTTKVFVSRTLNFTHAFRAGLMVCGFAPNGPSTRMTCRYIVEVKSCTLGRLRAPIVRKMIRERLENEYSHALNVVSELLTHPPR